MQSFEQVKHILDHSMNFHHKASLLFKDLKCKAKDEKTKNLAHYLCVHEEKLCSIIGNFEEQAKKDVLSKWFQFSAEESFEDILNNQTIPNEITVEFLIKLENEFDDYFMRLYDELASISINKVRDLFQNFFKEISEEKKQLSKIGNFLIDY